MCFLQIFVIVAPGFTASAVVGNVTTTSLVVSNVMGTPNATALGSDDISNTSLKTIIDITITGGIPANTVGVPIMKVCKTYVRACSIGYSWLLICHFMHHF